jgi:hypothetical protein
MVNEVAYEKSLAYKNPELAAEWDREKNGDLTPEKVTFRSTAKVWWTKTYTVPNDWPLKDFRGRTFVFSWKESVTNRSVGCNCPFVPPGCPKQESSVYMWLMDKGVNFVREQSYVTGKNTANGVYQKGRFDIYIPDKNCVIEIDGRQHFSDKCGFGRMSESARKEKSDDIKRADAMKNAYCEEHGITLLRLPYKFGTRTNLSMLADFMDTNHISHHIIEHYREAQPFDISGKESGTYADIATRMNTDEFQAFSRAQTGKVKLTFLYNHAMESVQSKVETIRDVNEKVKLKGCQKAGKERAAFVDDQLGLSDEYHDDAAFFIAEVG